MDAKEVKGDKVNVIENQLLKVVTEIASTKILVSLMFFYVQIMTKTIIMREPTVLRSGLNSFPCNCWGRFASNLCLMTHNETAVFPSPTSASMAAPCWISSFTIARKPSAHAIWSAVSPLFKRASMSWWCLTMWRRTHSTMLSFPLRTAMWRGVAPSGLDEFRTSGNFSTIISITLCEIRIKVGVSRPLWMIKFSWNSFYADSIKLFSNLIWSLLNNLNNGI